MVHKLTQPAVAAALFVVVGLAAFATGLGNPFLGDDKFQIVLAPPVHSVSNLVSFFQGGTFFLGHSPLAGEYYRPLQTLSYALLWTLFGNTPAPFHVLQLAVCVGTAFFVYRFLAFSLDAFLALILALVFLVHPANSQVVYSIPKMGDALSLFFGMLGMWLLVRYRGMRSLGVVTVVLFLSLLSKEGGVLFFAVAAIYLWGWDRERLRPFVLMAAAAAITYLILRIGAVGLNNNPHNAPIDSLSLGGRLMTIPSLGVFYITKFLWPVPLASAYYWVHKDFTLQTFAVPLAVDLLVIALMVWGGMRIEREGTRSQTRTYWFFGAWAVIGFLAISQITPLDMTASENWMYFPLVGILGMVGISATVLWRPLASRWPGLPRDARQLGIAAGLALVVLLGIRTALRGPEWSSELTLAQHDLAVSDADYQAEIAITYPLMQAGQFQEAVFHAQKAVEEYPTLLSYHALGLTLLENGNYRDAQVALQKALHYQDAYFVYDDLGLMTPFYGEYAANRAMLLGALQKFPDDGKLWLYLAVIDQQNHNNAEAQVAISNAYRLGSASQSTVAEIENNQRLLLPPKPGLDA